MTGQPVFQQGHGLQNDEVEGQVDERRAEEDLHGAVAVGNQPLGHSGHFPYGDKARKRRRLHHQHDLGRVGRQRVTEGNRCQNAANEERAGHADRHQ